MSIDQYKTDRERDNGINHFMHKRGDHPMLLVQYLVIVVWQLDALVSWWVFVGMLLTLARLYLRRVVGGRWRQPERLARVMVE